MVEFDGNVSGSRGSTPRKPEGYGSEPLTEEIAKKILIDFKKKDTDTSMRVSFDELSNAIIKEYVDNGYKRTDAHAQGETIADLLNYYQERAKEYDANGDGALNIDEYSAMFREKFEEEEKASKKPPATDAGGPTRAEEPKKPLRQILGGDGRKVTPGSMVFVPGTAGLLLASEVVKDLLERQG